MAEDPEAGFDWRDAAASLLLLLFVAWYVWAELDLRGGHVCVSNGALHDPLIEQLNLALSPETPA